jgi:asparagine synthase (glutamine-hydrolysing)
MCGITGLAGFDDDTLLRGMCGSLAHRGPDDEGYHTAPGVGLAMRRLSVIDLKTGHQPIANETGSVWVVFNGEIYNYQDLRRDLLSRGHRFSTTSDTETLVHLYEERGVDFVQPLRGMFGVAVWDAARRRLVLARDRIGEKPLYYAIDGQRLLFGSEIKAILRAGGRRAADRQAVAQFLATGYVPGSRTMYEGIAKLPPAHRLVFENGTARVERYWTRSTASSAHSEPEAEAQLEALLDEAVRLNLKSDVEVGAFLSGGVDSSLLVALMRRHEAQVKTFTVGYRGAARGFNELQYARRVATKLGTDHHELILDASSSLDLLPRILSHYDEPHGEPTSVLVYQLSEFTRRHVKVAVGGTGGDEIFFGYPRHAGVRYLDYYQRLPRWIRRGVLEPSIARWPESTTGSRLAKRARRFVRGGALPPGQAYLAWTRLLDRDTHAALCVGLTSGLDDAAGDAFLRERLTGNDAAGVLAGAARIDIEGYLPEYQLAYIDRMSMAHGLEVRSPLCDYVLVDFVQSLPPGMRLKGSRSKHLLKQVARRFLPADIVDRPKVGFDSPIGQWFKDELRPFLTGFLAPPHVRATGLLDPDAVQALVAAHLSGARDYSLPLWSVLMVEAWHRMYIENRHDAADACRLTDLRGAEAAA